MPDVYLPTFHPGQRHAWEMEARFRVLRCGRRWGKALSIDTLIPTPNGWRTMEQIQEDDLVFDETGTPCRVIGATDIQFDRPCNRVIFSDGSELIADDAHQWLTWDRLDRKNESRGLKYAPAIRTTLKIRNTLKRGKDINHSIPTAGPVQYPTRVLPLPPYVLGAWLGDGTSRLANIATDDPQILDELAAEGWPTTPLKDKFMHSFGATGTGRKPISGGFLDIINKLKVRNNKHIPEEYLQGGVAQRLALLQGLMDTDGYVHSLGNCEFTNTNKTLAYQTLELILSLGIRATLITGRATIAGRDCGEKYRIKFTTAMQVFRLQRKRARLPVVQPRMHRYIVAVIPIPSVPVKCIAVDSPNKLYLAGEQFIITHNTDFFKTIAGDGAAKGMSIGWFTPNYKIQAEAFNEIAELLAPIKKNSSKIDGVFRTTTGGRIDFWTLENPRAGRSRKYNRVIVDEAAFAKDDLGDIWERSIKPTLLDLRGTAYAGSTPNGINDANFFYNICKDAEAKKADPHYKSRYNFKEFHAPTHQNPHLHKGELRKLKRDNHPLVYQQEYLAEFVDWRGVQFFELAKMLDPNGYPVAIPQHIEGVYAVIDSAVKDGLEHDGTGVTYYGISPHHGDPLVILDWDIVQIEGALLETWLPLVFQTLEALARETRARNGMLGVFIEDKASGTILLQQAQRRGWPAQAIDSKLTAVGKDERALSVSGYVHRGMVKIAERAYNKVATFKNHSRNHFLTQVLGFRMGDKDAYKRADDLLDTFTYGLSIGLGNTDGY